MKKRMFSLFVALVLCVGVVAAPAGAVEVGVPISESNGRVVQESGPMQITTIMSMDEFREQEGSRVLINGLDVTADEQGETVEFQDVIADEKEVQPYASDSINRMIPGNLLVYPTIEENGQIGFFEDVYWMFTPNASDSYISVDLTLDEQEELKNLFRSRGVEPTGWLMASGYSVQVYSPISWSYYTWTAAGKSSLKGTSAKNGQKIFQVYSAYPTEPSSTYYWKLGVEGTLSYKPSATGSTVKMPMELSVSIRTR